MSALLVALADSDHLTWPDVVGLLIGGAVSVFVLWLMATKL